MNPTFGSMVKKPFFMSIFVKRTDLLKNSWRGGASQDGTKNIRC